MLLVQLCLHLDSLDLDLGLQFTFIINENKKLRPFNYLDALDQHETLVASPFAELELESYMYS